MKRFEEVVLILGFVAYTLTVGQVRGDAASNFDKAFNSLSVTEKTAFQSTLGLGFFKSLKEIANCIENIAFPIDFCDFHTSIDPFYYLIECANGTVVQQVLEKLIRNIPQLEVPFGVPQEVTNQRCYRPTPFITPTIKPPISVSPGIGPRPFGR